MNYTDAYKSFNNLAEGDSAYEQRMITQIKRAKKDGVAIFKLPTKTQEYYRKNKRKFEQGLNEEKATCCGKCGRVHVKGTKCKTPYLKGAKHCRNNK